MKNETPIHKLRPVNYSYSNNVHIVENKNVGNVKSAAQAAFAAGAYELAKTALSYIESNDTKGLFEYLQAAKTKTFYSEPY
ncbi:MAG: hypothetical protein ACPG32_02570 [Akkermansiaceae bacterium]